MTKELDADYYEETELNTHTYTNGAKDCYVDKIYVSKGERPTRVRLDGSITPVAIPIPTELTRERLTIGTDSKKSYIRFEVKVFTKHPASECWELQKVKRYYGISFTLKTMKKIANYIESIS